MSSKVSFLGEDGQFRPVKMKPQKSTVSQDKTFLGEAGRHVSRSLARAGESVLGLPGDLLSIVRAPELLPKTSTIRKHVTEKLTGDYLKPQSKAEEFFDNVVEDAALLWTPTKFLKGSKTASSLIKMAAKGLAGSLAKSALGNVAAGSAEKFGGGPKSQVAAKIGTMLLLNRVGKQKPREYAKGLYEKADALMPSSRKKISLGPGSPPSQLVNAPSLKAYTITEARKLAKGGFSKPETEALKKLKILYSKFEGNQISMEELTRVKRSIQADIPVVARELGKETRYAKMMNGLTGEISKTIQNQKRRFPEFVKAYNEAESAYSAVRASEVVGNAIKKHIKIPYVRSSPVLGALLGGASLFPKLRAATGIVPAYKTWQILYRVSKSPAMRRYYSQAISAATKGNYRVMNHNFAQLDKLARKQGIDRFEPAEMKKSKRFSTQGRGIDLTSPEGNARTRAQPTQIGRFTVGGRPIMNNEFR